MKHKKTMKNQTTSITLDWPIEHKSTLKHETSSTIQDWPIVAMEHVTTCTILDWPILALKHKYNIKHKTTSATLQRKIVAMNTMKHKTIKEGKHTRDHEDGLDTFWYCLWLWGVHSPWSWMWFLPEESVSQGVGWGCSVGTGWVRLEHVRCLELFRHLAGELKVTQKLLGWGWDERGGIRRVFVSLIIHSNENKYVP